MSENIIIADAGPLIAFAKIKHINLLAETLGKIIVTKTVLNECTAHSGRPGAKEILDATNKEIITLHNNPNGNHNALCEILGPGEASAIMLALQLKTGILIDEKLGRKAACKMNLHVIGTAGTLLLAKKKKLIKKVAPIIQELKGAGYFLSKELIHAVLIKAKENLTDTHSSKFPLA